MGKTHKAGGFLAMLLAYDFMYKRGLLSAEIHPLVQYMIMLPAASWGSIAPDLDQSTDSLPDKSPLSLAVHKLLQVQGVRHRSWQTHSWSSIISICLFVLSLLYFLCNLPQLQVNNISATIMILFFVGAIVGIVSHLFLDTLTYDGVQLIPGVWIRLFRKDMFKTGTKYEKVIRVLLYFGTATFLIYKLILLIGV